MAISAPRQPKRIIRTGPLLLGFALAKMRALHPLMPPRLRYQLPTGWTPHMLRTFLGSGRKKVYIDVHTRLNPPASHAPRAPVAPEWRMSEDEIRGFWERGFAGPYPLLTPEAMGELRDKMWGLWDKPSTTYPPGSYRYVGTNHNVDGSGEMSNEEYATRGLNARDKHLEDGALVDLYAHPAIVERIAQLLGPDLLLWRTQFFPKYPGMGGTGWHQATSYLNETMRTATLTPPRLDELFQLTAWIAVTDSTIENGCLRMIPGTHRELLPMNVEEYDPQRHAENKSDRFGTKILRPADGIRDADAVNFVMKAGEFVIFSERVMHGALPNLTADESRLGMSGRYVVPDVKIHNPWILGEGGLSIAYLRIQQLRLDRWRALLVRGEDRSRANGDRVVRYRPGMVVNP
ncbi:MAG: phytanoyl-CoA dioxygenase family protein [Nannocystaceae bacterium]